MLGLCVWAAGYLAWLPALGITPPVTEQRAEQITASLLKHALSGVEFRKVTRYLVNPDHATVLRVEPNGQSRVIFARGLRINGLWLGLPRGRSTAGRVESIGTGKDYGWPFCYGDREADELLPSTPDGKSKAQYCAASESPTLTYQAHSAPIAMIFYRGKQFPASTTSMLSWRCMARGPTGYNVRQNTLQRRPAGEFSRFL